MIYKQLFPNFTITNVSPFHYLCNCVNLGGDLLGSVSNAASAKTSAVITAFWPTRNAELTTPLNLSCMRVVVQYYFKQIYKCYKHITVVTGVPAVVRSRCNGCLNGRARSINRPVDGKPVFKWSHKGAKR